MLEAQPGQSLVESLLGPAESIHQRFPGLDDLLLQEQVFAAYQIEVADHIPYLKADGSPNVMRHRCNDRSYDETTEDLAVSIESRGCMIGVRGEAWAVKGSTYQMLTWGHLTDAVLLANSRSPVNPFVQATVARGLEHVTVFHDRMPDDVASYLVRLHNDFHGGAATSFLEVLGELQTIEAGWKTYREENRITSRGGAGAQSYDKIYWRYVQKNFPNFATSWAQYETRKALLKVMTLQRDHLVKQISMVMTWVVGCVLDCDLDCETSCLFANKRLNLQSDPRSEALRAREDGDINPAGTDNEVFWISVLSSLLDPFPNPIQDSVLEHCFLECALAELHSGQCSQTLLATKSVLARS